MYVYEVVLINILVLQLDPLKQKFLAPPLDTCVLGSWNSPKFKADVYPKASQEEDWCFGALCSSNLLT